MRSEVEQLVALGALPSSKNVDTALLERQGKLIERLKNPATDEEACALLQILGPDDCFGLAWTVLHFIETAPGWPIQSCLSDKTNEWVMRLRQRAVNAGLLKE